MKVRTDVLALATVLAVAGCAALQPEPPPEQNAALRLDRALFALDAGRYREAFDDLAWVHSACYGRTVGVQALAALAALELDPRNRAARPDVGAELLGRLIQDSATPAWLRPLAETNLLTALALGTPHPADTLAGAPAARTSADRDDGAMDDTTAGEELADPDSSGSRVEPSYGDRVDSALRPRTPVQTDVYGCGEPVPMPEGWQPPELPRLPGPSMADMLVRVEASRDALSLQADSLRNELRAANEQLTATREELERIRKTLRP